MFGISFYQLDYTNAVRISYFIYFIGSLIDSVERISVLHLYNNKSIFSWEVLSPPSAVKSLSVIYGWRSFKFTVFINCFFLILSGIILSSFGVNSIYFIITHFLFYVTKILIFNRTTHSSDGSDQLSNMLSCTFLFLSISIEVQYQYLTLFVISFQLSLSYLAAGLVKLISKDWRNGIALHYILLTKSYSVPIVEKIAYSIYKMRILSWLIISFECLFFFIVLMSDRYRFLMLLFGLLFHLLNSMIMGLNRFLFFFVAVYPLFYFSISNNIVKVILKKFISEYLTYNSN